jgi:hypothetical protein
MKRIIILSTIGLLFIVLAAASSDSAKEGSKNPECGPNDSGYKMGFEIGKTSAWDTPEGHIRNCNRGAGMIGEVPPCWHEGFRAGHDARK